MAGYPRTLMPHPRSSRKKRGKIPGYAGPLAVVVLISGALLVYPHFLAQELAREEAMPPQPAFPVSVDPKRQVIVENPQVDAMFTGRSASLTAAALEARGMLGTLADLISKIPGYALLGAADTHFVTIYPGYREEQVAAAFGKALGWNPRTQQRFLTQVHTSAPTLLEGEFPPGTYVVPGSASLTDVQGLLGKRFDETIISRYSTTTAAVVPLDQALTIASLLERETRDPNEMRLISGIIWNRTWNHMNLQIDATLQYAKGSSGSAASWWPRVVPKDKYIKSPYNTYQHAGLPPTPIANPSIAAVLAALNPKPTDCLFYFHDKHGVFHCAPTYEEHVKLLRQYYGQGK